jgi:hypothetical protein
VKNGKTICALCGKSTESHPAVPLGVDDPDRRWDMVVHRSCLAELLAAENLSVPSNLGRIPSDAACGVCGRRLPVIGWHPYALTLPEPAPSRTWFVHAECFPESLRIRLRQPPT